MIDFELVVAERGGVRRDARRFAILWIPSHSSWPNLSSVLQRSNRSDPLVLVARSTVPQPARDVLLAPIVPRSAFRWIADVPFSRQREPDSTPYSVPEYAPPLLNLTLEERR